MNTLLAGPWWTPLVTALAHSLWQGAIIAGLLLLALRTVPARCINARYGLAAASMLLLVLSWLITWTWLERSLPPATDTPPSAISSLTRLELPAPEPPPSPPASHTSHGSHSSHKSHESLAPVPPHPLTTPRFDPRWHARLGLAWLAGMLLFQIRILLSVGQARSLVHQSHIVTDPGLLSRFDRLRRALGLHDRIALRVSPTLSVPAAWGILKPVVLLPASCLARVSPPQLEAILAHELAHLRRHDVLANLVHMAIEGLFFFNPFAWWIGRQIRLEREVCCDALAVTATGEPLTYAQTLASLVAPPDLTPLAPPAPMPALGQARNPILERLRRLLQPHHTPSLHLPRTALILTLLLGGLALILMKWTTGAALEALAPAQRIERFSELRAEYPNPTLNLESATSEDSTPTALIMGHVRTVDNAPLPRATWLHATSRRSGHSAAFSVDVAADGRFTHSVPMGALYLAAQAEGYAPSFVGPLESPGPWTNLTLTLDRGFTSVLRLTDPDGRPVPTARILSRYDYPANPGILESVSDADGRVTFEHLGTQPLHLEVEADGFQFDTLRNAALSPDEALTWVLQPAVPASGIVVFADTGEPVAGAEIHLGQRTGSQPISYGKPGEQNFLSRADANGRFQLNSLRDDAQYRLLVSGPGASGIVTGPVGSGDNTLRFELPRAVLLQVHVRNIAPTHLDGQGRLTLHASAFFKFDGHSHSSSESFHAVPENGVATFPVGPLWRSPLSLKIAESEFNLRWEEAQAHTEPVIIDLAIQDAPPPKADPVLRTLRFVFPDSPDRPAPTGAVLVEYVHEMRMTRVLAQITNHQARVQIPVPTRVELLPTALDGYWFAPKSLEITAAPEPLDIPLETFPAGAIHGEVVEEDGQPATGIMISVIPLEPRPPATGSSLGVTVKNSTDSSDQVNRFLAGPLPFDGRYAICAYRGTTYTVTEPLLINAAVPFHEIRMVLPRGINLTGTILRPDGTPQIRETVEFHFSPTAGHGFSGAKAMTDRAGRFTFAHVNPDVLGDYYLILPLRRDFQPLRHQVVPGEPIEIRLKPGLILEGQVLDHQTRLPIPGAEVFALPSSRESQSRWTTWFDAEGPTDSEGRFRFSNLDPGDHQVLTRSGRITTRNQPRPAGGDPVILLIEPHAGSRPSR